MKYYLSENYDINLENPSLASFIAFDIDETNHRLYFDYLNESLSRIQIKKSLLKIDSFARKNSIKAILLPKKLITQQLVEDPSFMNRYGFRRQDDNYFIKTLASFDWNSYASPSIQTRDQLRSFLESLGINYELTESSLTIYNTQINSIDKVIDLSILKNIDTIFFFCCSFLGDIRAGTENKCRFDQCHLENILLLGNVKTKVEFSSCHINGIIEAHIGAQGDISIEDSFIKDKIDLVSGFKTLSINSSHIDSLNLVNNSISNSGIDISASHINSINCRNLASSLRVSNSIIANVHLNQIGDVSLLGTHLKTKITTLFCNGISSLNIDHYLLSTLSLHKIQASQKVRFNRITVEEKMIFSECIFENLSISNCNFSKVITQLHFADFSKSIFFNTKWGEFKEIENHEDAKLDLRESFRTLKNAYKNQNDIINYLYFYNREINEISNSSSLFKNLNSLDRIILIYNQITGFGVSPIQSLIALFIWSSLNAVIIQILSGNCLISISDFATLIELTSKKDEGINSMFNPLYLLFYKAVLASLYYQVILSFRKFHSK